MVYNINVHNIVSIDNNTNEIRQDFNMNLLGMRFILKLFDVTYISTIYKKYMINILR